ncbi:hypothetical protein HHK36_017546 [Tetracentron sinense]|uniref:Uncharacterized protein n=1 Tax=Tetracentron sinense TaxID=13715 RepID=A0A834Z1F3_TETSI|nr:hypothetical protein HHK36_017546 [Tetracentron sinense]
MITARRIMLRVASRVFEAVTLKMTGGLLLTELVGSIYRGLFVRGKVGFLEEKLTNSLVQRGQGTTMKEKHEHAQSHRYLQCSPRGVNSFSIRFLLPFFFFSRASNFPFIMPCSSLRTRIRSWLRDYDKIQAGAVILIYIQIGCALVGSLGALYNGVLMINLAIALFALVAIESSSQSLGRTYAALLLSAILLDILWFILFSNEIW